MNNDHHPTVRSKSANVQQHTTIMGILGSVTRGIFQGGLTVASFGLGFTLFARPWPDSPMWARPMDLVKDKKANVAIETYSKLPSYPTFSDMKVFESYMKDENFELITTDRLVPEAHRYNQVSRGLMDLNNPIVMINKKEGELVLFGRADSNNMIGLDGKIHNGIILTLFDESLCICGFDKLPSKRGVTAKLNVNFSNKLQPNSTFMLTAKVTESRGRKVIIDGKLLPLDRKGKVGTSISDARCILVEPTWFKYFGWVDLF